MATEYTHDFKFNVGGMEIDAELEFNTDGIASMTTDSPLSLTIPQNENLLIFIKNTKELFNCFGSIENIRIKKKEG